MRIHNLTFAGIGPFREEQTIAFDTLGGAGMFLLEGPTGVGKSTIIDAIVFALYGKGAAEDGDSGRLVSQFRAAGDPAPYAEMVFSTARGTFRVRRTPVYLRLKARATSDDDLRKENATASLVRLSSPADAEGTPMGSGMAEIGSAVTDVLGLTREQFISTIVLPQGEFARFLRSSTDDKRRILQSIFRTHVFQKVQERLRAAGHAAELRCQEAGVAVISCLDTLRGALGETHAAPLADLGPATCADTMREAVVRVLEGLAAKVTESDAALQMAEQTFQSARSELSGLDIRITKRDELAAAMRRMASLQDRHTEIAAMAAALDDDDRAGRVNDALTSAVRSAEAAATAQQRLGDAQRHAPAGLANADAATLREISQTARQTVGALQTAVKQEVGLPAKSARHAGLLVEAEQLRDQIATLEEQSARLPQEIDDARQALAAQRVLAGQVPQLEQAISTIGKQARAAAQLADLNDEQQRAASALAAELVKAQDADAVVTDLTARYRAGIAATIGATLTRGEPCPACGSREHPRPAAPSEDHVTSDQVDAATNAAARQRGKVAAAQGSLADLEARRAELAAVAQGTTVEQAAAETSALQGSLRSARDATRAADATQQTIEELTGRLDAVGGHLRRAAAGAAATDSSAAALLREIDATRDEIAEAVAGFPTVAARVAHLQRQIGEGEALLALHQEASATRATAAQAAATLRDALNRERFGDAAEVQAAILTRSRRTQLRTAVDAHRTDVITTRAMLERPDLWGIDATERIDREPAAAALAQAQQRRDQLVGTCTSLNAVLQRARTCGDDLDRAVEERDALQSSLRAVIELGNFAKGRNRLDMDLATFVVVRRFASVIEAANHHLTDMSNGRLSLEAFEEATGTQQRGGLGIRVFDHHTEQTRSPKTLSGGETFFTSLSLALGLAEIVTSESGGVALDTLFVDEGFGSLDQETLDNVMAALAGLQRDGRVLGLVSHVTEMKERIPERIEVRRSRTTGPSELQVRA